MGVPGFNTWFSSTACPNAFVDHSGKRFDHVLIDLASVLHTVFRHASSSNRVHKLLYVELDSILLRYQPTKSVLFAMDGPAPLAKLITQRNRRAVQSKRESRRGSKGLSPLGLTPGTELMLELEDSLTFYVSQRLQTRWPNLHFELSGATVAGEGEVKIFERLLNPMCPISPEDEIAVIGSDSDLYLMALLHKPAASLWVLPELEPRRPRDLQRLHSSGFSINALNRNWTELKQVKGSGSSEVVRMRVESLKSDLAAIAILANGNDYLPGIMSTSLETHAGGKGLWDAYLNLRLNPDWVDRRLVLPEAAGPKLDTEVLSALMKKHSSQNRYAADPDRDGWTLRKPPSDPSIYLKGIEWVLDMYLQGRCTDFRFMYDAQTPAVAELVDFLGAGNSATDQASAISFTRENLLGEAQTLEQNAAPIPAVCALALLPSGRGAEHVPQALRDLMQPGSPIADLYEGCSECDAHVNGIREVTKALTQALRSQALKAIKPSNDKGANNSDAGPSIASLRHKLRQQEEKRLQHVLKAHPYEKFPIERIEQAVAAIPTTEFTPSQQKLLQFGRANSYWKKLSSEQCCCSTCRSGDANAICSYSFEPPPVPGQGLRRVAGNGLRCSELPDPSASSSGRLPPLFPSHRLSEAHNNSALEAPSVSCRCPRCIAWQTGETSDQLPLTRQRLGSSRRTSLENGRSTLDSRRQALPGPAVQSRSLAGWPSVLRRPVNASTATQALSGRAGMCTLLSMPPRCHIRNPTAAPLVESTLFSAPGSMQYSDGEPKVCCIARILPRLKTSLASGRKPTWQGCIKNRRLMHFSRHALTAMRHLCI